MKHTIKLLTLAFMLAAILTLTGCPGPVNTVNHDWVFEEDTATCKEDGVKTYKCSRCDETKTENSPAHHTFIAGGCDKCGSYEHNKEDDYQIMAYVYSSVEDAKNGKNETVLYFSFPNDTTDLCISIDDLIQMKDGYAGKTVKYFNFNSPYDFLEIIDLNVEYSGATELLTNLKCIYIVVE